MLKKFRVPKGVRTITFEILDEDAGGEEDDMGSVEVHLKDIPLGPEGVQQTYDIKPAGSGTLELLIVREVEPKGGGAAAAADDKKKKKQQQQKQQKQEEQKQKKQQEEETRRKRGNDAKASSGDGEEKKRAAEKAKKKAEKERKQREQTKKKNDRQKKEWDWQRDAEWGDGTYDARKRPFSRVETDDPCCGCGTGAARCCRAVAFLALLLLYPSLYGLLLYNEHRAHGWGRVLDRSAGKGGAAGGGVGVVAGTTTKSERWGAANDTAASGSASSVYDASGFANDGSAPTLAAIVPNNSTSGTRSAPHRSVLAATNGSSPSSTSAKTTGAPTPTLIRPEASGAANAGDKRDDNDDDNTNDDANDDDGSNNDDDSKAEDEPFAITDHPLLWILPLLGLGHGFFTNMVPISGGLVLVPLFQTMGVSKSSATTLALGFLVQSVSNGLLGWTVWMARDPRLLVCRALFLLVPCGWAGYALGVTNHLSLKDVLLEINEGLDDDYEGATHSLRESIDEADIALLHTYLRIALGAFMCMMSVFVLVGACVGGMSRYCCCTTRTGGSLKGCAVRKI